MAVFISRRFLLFCLLLLPVWGCVANQQQYAAPLYEMEVIKDPTASNWQIKEVSEGELANLELGYRPAPDSDEAGIWYVLDKAEKEMRDSGAVLHDEALQGYLHEVSCKLAPEYCGDIRIYVVRAPYFNASMAANGALTIWTGLLLRAQNEAQLASVIGHEMGHYLRRHSLQRMRDVINTTSTLAFVRVASAMVGLGFVGDVAYIAGISNLQSFSRDMEREADGYGLALMSRAGYDPRQTARLWRHVIKEKEADEDEKFSMLLFDSHPPSEERLAALEKLAERITSEQPDRFYLAADHYQQVIAAHRGEFLQADLNLCNFSRSQVLLQSLNEQHPGDGELLFYQAELYRLRGKNDDKEKALELYQQAALANRPPPEVFRAIGLLQREKGQNDQARSAFEQYLAQKPDAADREMIQHMLTRNLL